MPYQDLLLTVVPILFGIAIKYQPALKKVPNALIPYLGFALALVTKLADQTPEVAPAGYVTAGLLSGWGAFLAPVLSAGWTAVQNSLIYEVFLRAPVGSVLRKP